MLKLFLLATILIGSLLADDLMPYMPFYQDKSNNDEKSIDEANNNDNADPSNSIKQGLYSQSNKEFWENMYQNSMLNKKTRFDILNGGSVCFTCPIDRNTFNSLYDEARAQASIPTSGSSIAPPKITIGWASEITQNRVVFFCKNNTKTQKNPIRLANPNSEYSSSGGNSELEYVCEDNKLCLINVKNNYPQKYQCWVKSYVLDVNLNVVVQLQYVLLYFSGDSVKFDFQKEVQVHEDQTFSIKCEVPETNPVSTVKAFIDNEELRLTKLDKKTIDNRMSINTYSFDVIAKRNMNGKRVRCEASMMDLPPDLANSIDLRSHIIKDAILSVYYVPTCQYKTRTYRTGINRTILIECPINASNPDVTYYKMIPPSTRTKFELLNTDVESLRSMAQFRIMPKSQADFGLFECIPRSSAGTAKCDINVELADTPNPPEQCTVQFAKVNNKTFAQFSCKPGFNQGGQTSFLTIYEKVDEQLKLSGRVNIDESKIDKEVPYITPADEDKYYEFLIMQENNYGNSTPILLTLGQSMEIRQSKPIDTKTIYTIAGCVGGLILFVCICACCCCNDFCSSTRSDNPCCKCCNPNSDPSDDDGLSYKKAPMDAMPPNHQLHQTFPYNPTGTLSKQFVNNQQHYTTNLNNSSSNYDYYDNTSSGLLADQNNPYSRYSNPKTSSRGNLLLSSTQVTNQSGKLLYGGLSNNQNNHDDEDDDDDEEPYMNDNEEILTKNQRNILSNYQHSSAVNSQNEDEIESLPSLNTNLNINNNNNNKPMSTTTTATNVTPLTNGRKTPITDKKDGIITNKTLFGNSNLSGLIGSGVDSINKKNSPYLTLSKLNNQISSNKQQTYSTIDSRKYIKTENGLVYTAINGTAITNTTIAANNKSSDALMSNQQEDEITDSADEIDIENHHYHYADGDDFDLDDNENEEFNSRPNSISNKISNNNNPIQQYLQKQNQNFKNELNQRLKSINKDTIVNNNDIYSKNYTNNKTNMNNINSSTVTTSVSSSASTCSSTNCDEINIVNNGKLQSLNNRDKNYSLLKTTLHLNGSNNNSNETTIINENSNINNSNIKSQNKPPILKPKPRTNNVNGNLNNFKKQLNSTSESLHNQSNEPLLLLKQETSLQTTPSTSVTDVSSNNCTPQHLVEDVNVNNNKTKSNKLNVVNQMPRSRSNSNSNNSNTNQQKINNGITNGPTKLNTNNNNNVYSTLNNRQTMKTFSSNNNNNNTSIANTSITLYERMHTNMASIDDEINMTKAKQANNNSLLQQRTLERRVVKNSEC